MKSFKLLFLIFIPLTVLVSCSGSNNPTIPQTSPDGFHPPDQIAPVSGNYAQCSNRGVFGAWEIHIDKTNLTAEVIPARKAVSIGHIFDADLLQFLTVSPCANCMWVTSFRFSDRYLLLDVKLRHPFADIVKRPDLHAFDVRAIILADPQFPDSFGIDMMKPDGVSESTVVGSSLLLNPDGYTSHHSDIIHDSRYFIADSTISGNIFPYIRFFDDFSTADFDPNAPAGHNVMPVGSSISTKTMVINADFLNDEINLYVIADMAYGQSATFVNRTSPQYYLPAFNRTEPWRIEYWTENNNLDYSVTGSKTDLVVQVFDWQQSATVDPNYPDPANLDGISESSKVTQVEVMFPGLMTGKLVSTTSLAGDGSPANPLQYRFEIENQISGTHSNYGLLAARDELYGQAAPSGRFPIPESPSGFPYETEDIRDYSLYQLIYVNIPYADGKAVDFNGELDVKWSTCYRSQLSDTFKIYTDFYSDVGATKYQYDWDFDYNGSTFDLDGSGMPSPPITLASTGRQIVGLKVTTSSVPSRQYIYSIPVNVKGLNFDSTIGSSFNNYYRTSMSRGQSVAVTDDRYYVAYTSKESGRWNIMVTVFESDGTSHDHHVTNATTSNYMYPSIIAIEEDGNEGLYLTFTSIPDGDPWDVYSSYGNLDGGGFFEGNIKPISTEAAATEYLPQLVYFNGALYAYYLRADFMSSRIYVCQSTDKGLTWTDNAAIDPGAMSQVRFAVAPISDYVEIVYEGVLDYNLRGIDLFLAKSAVNNPLTYSAGVDISTVPGKIHETYPSISVYNDTTYIAYLQREDSSEQSIVYLTTIKDNTISDRKVRNHSSYDCTPPGVTALSEKSAVISFGARSISTDILTGVIMKATILAPYPSSSESELVAVTMGDLGPQDYPIYPGVASINRNGVRECFVAFTDYTSGMDSVGSPTQEYFGDLRTISYIVEASF